MRTILAHIGSLLAGILLILTANGLLATLLSIRLTLDGVPAAATGLILAAYHVGFFVGALRGQAVLRSVGHIRAFAVFAATMTCAALLHGLLPNPIAWAGLRLVAGFAMAGLFLATESWLNERATAETRGTVLSTYMISVQAGLGVGQLLLMVAPVSGQALFMLAATLFALALIPVGLTRAMAPAPPDEQHLPLRQLYTISPIGVVGAGVAGVVQAAFAAMGPVYAAAIGLDPAGVALFMAAVVLGGITLQWPLGALSDRVGRATVQGGTLTGLVVVCIWLAQPVQAGPGDLALRALLYGGLVYMLYPLAVAQANDWATTSQRVGVAGGLLITYGVGAVAGPIAGGLAMQWGGPGGLFLMQAGLLGVLLLFVLRQLLRRPQLVPALQTPFVPVTRTSTMAAELDDRLQEDPVT